MTSLFALSVLAAPCVVPQPASANWEAGSFEFSASTQLVVKSQVAAAGQLRTLFSKPAGFKLQGSGRGGAVVIRMKSDTRKLRPDWYWLKIEPKRITIEYSSEAGAFYAVQTLRQLLPDEIEAGKRMPGVKWTVPCGEIVDGPNFRWRGMLLDCSRHFWPVSFIKKTLDRLALLKMNVFHWHLVDDGGWRMEVKRYPNLTNFGAWRLDTGEVWPGGRWNYANVRFVGKNSTSRKYGGYYTQAQIRDIVKYAAARHITVVPEIELPGHSLAALVSYPELTCQGVPKAEKPGMSVSNVYCAGSDVSIKFLENVLDETLKLFPSQFIHIGGDETLKDYWHNCSKCQARMKANGLKTEHELQSWFVQHFDQYLAKRGRRLIGWDEILEGGLAPGATVMSWRGNEGGVTAAKANHDVVMTPTSHCYFDYSYESIPTKKVYEWGVTPPEIADTPHVLGGQFNVWTEWIATEQRCEELQFPRALAMAESLWTAPEAKDWASYTVREAALVKRLSKMGVTVHKS